MKMSNKRRANVSYYNESSSDDDYDYEIPDDSVLDCDSSSRANSSVIGSSINQNENEQPVKRRGRGPSKRPCLNRNALMARKNRQKKKEYLENVENKLTYYRNENTKLVNILKKQDINLKRLNAEVLYLKNVLKNNTSITALLNSMNSAINNRNCDKKNNLCNNSEGINDKTTMDNVGKNTMVTEWMNHGMIPVNYENADVIDEKGVDCDLRSSELIISENDSKSFNNKSSNVLTTAAASPPPSLASPSSSNSCNIDRFNTDIIDEESPMMLLNDEDNLLDDYLKCDSNNSLDADNLLGNLDTSGICLHVNADRISLEFCSICHLNSINSEDL